MLESLTLGILIASVHYDNGNPNFIDPEQRRVHNGFTPGIYIQDRKSCLTAGYYYNSWRRQSTFIGCTASISVSEFLEVSISGGAISGYASGKILFAPSIRYKSIRTFIIPGNLPTASVAYEISF